MRSTLTLSSLVRKWLRYALDDLRVARSIETFGSSHWRACAYHSQQAVEKAIKGYLAHQQIRFPKTHVIAALVELVAEKDPALARELRPTMRLSKFAIEYRYPDAASRPMTRANARSATKVAEKAYEAIAARLRSK